MDWQCLKIYNLELVWSNYGSQNNLCHFVPALIQTVWQNLHAQVPVRDRGVGVPGGGAIAPPNIFKIIES